MTTFETIFCILLVALAAWYAISIIVLLIGLFRIRCPVNDRLNFLTVVIAAHNEEKDIADCLKAIAAQNYPPNLYEVIIADDRSTDGTTDIIEAFCRDHYNFYSIRIDSKENEVIPKKTALIKALKMARGDIIVSTDGDCIQSEGWLSSINGCFAENVGMVIGHTSYPKPGNLWAGIDAIDYLSHRAMGAAFVGAGSAYTCTASNFAYRKDIFKSVEEEFSQLKVRPAEDNYLLNFVHTRTSYSFAVATDPESFVTTAGAGGFGEFMQQRFRWGAYGGNIVTTGVKLFFLPALLFYIVLWAGILLSMINPALIQTVLISLGLKAFVDLIFMTKASSIYKSRYLLVYFLPGFVANLILTIPVMVKGNFFTFRWKGESYRIN